MIFTELELPANASSAALQQEAVEQRRGDVDRRML
jgi:hypothetical protein